MLYINEVRKTFGRTALLLLLCILFLNGVLIVTGEKDRGYFFTAGDYRELYASEGMKGEPDEQLAFVEENLKDEMTRSYFLLSYVRSDIEKAMGYKAYLQNIAESASNYGRLSIFNDGDGFSGRNIKKTAEVYASLPDIETEAGPTRGVVMASRYSGSFMIGLMFIAYIVFSLVTREKEIGSIGLTFVSKFGHRHHGAAKLAVCLTASVAVSLLLEAENWVIASFTYGLGDIGRSIQSVPEYQPCVFNVSIRGFMFMSFCFKAACLFMFAAVIYFISCRSRNLPGLAVRLTAVFGMEGAAYFAIPGNSIWGLFRYINVFGGLDTAGLLGDYVNLDFFGRPVWYLPAYCIFVLIVISVFSVMGIMAYGSMQPIPSGTGLKFFRLPARTSSVPANEMYRYFICEHMLLILIAFAVMRAVTFSPVKETFAMQEDVYYKQYMLKLEGMYSGEKEEELAGEDRLYAEMTEKADTAAASTDDVMVQSLIWSKYRDETEHFSVLGKVREQAGYLKEKEGAFLYDQGYRILSGEDSGKEQNMLLAAFAGLMMVIGSAFMYGPDYQAGTEKMIRATERGRAYLFVRRELIGTFTLMLIFAAIYIPYTFSVLAAYGSQGLDFPACSLRCLEWCPHWLTIRGYLIGLNMVRFLILWAGMNLMWYISTKVRSLGYTFCIGVGIVVAVIMI